MGERVSWPGALDGRPSAQRLGGLEGGGPGGRRLGGLPAWMPCSRAGGRPRWWTPGKAGAVAGKVGSLEAGKHLFLSFGAWECLDRD